MLAHHTSRSVSQAGGAGSLFQMPSTTPNVGWAFMFGITSILGAWGAGTLGQSDWTRYAKTRHAPTPSQLLASPLTIAITAIIGIIVTSASRDILGGEVIWNPIFLLAAIQEYYQSSSGVRAGVFFAALGLVASQFSVRHLLGPMATISECSNTCGNRSPWCSTLSPAAWTWPVYGHDTSTSDAVPISWPSSASPFS